jgi:hypothetical protein
MFHSLLWQLEAVGFSSLGFLWRRNKINEKRKKNIFFVSLRARAGRYAKGFATNKSEKTKPTTDKQRKWQH